MYILKQETAIIIK